MKNLLKSGLGAARKLLEKAEAAIEEKSLILLTTEIPADSARKTSPEIAPVAEALSSVEDRVPMNDLLRVWAKSSGNTIKELKALLRSHMRVVRIDFMTVEQVKEACLWIEQRIEKAKAAGNAPTSTATHKTTEKRSGRKEITLSLMDKG